MASGASAGPARPSVACGVVSRAGADPRGTTYGTGGLPRRGRTKAPAGAGAFETGARGDQITPVT